MLVCKILPEDFYIFGVTRFRFRVCRQVTVQPRGLRDPSCDLGGSENSPISNASFSPRTGFRKILAPRMVQFLWASCRGPSPRIPPQSTHITSKVWDDQACTMHATSWQSLSETLILLDAMSILDACLSSKVLLGH